MNDEKHIKKKVQEDSDDYLKRYQDAWKERNEVLKEWAPWTEEELLKMIRSHKHTQLEIRQRRVTRKLIGRLAMTVLVSVAAAACLARGRVEAGIVAGIAAAGCLYSTLQLCHNLWLLLLMKPTNATYVVDRAAAHWRLLRMHRSHRRRKLKKTFALTLWPKRILRKAGVAVAVFFSIIVVSALLVPSNPRQETNDAIAQNATPSVAPAAAPQEKTCPPSATPAMASATSPAASSAAKASAAKAAAAPAGRVPATTKRTPRSTTAVASAALTTETAETLPATVQEKATATRRYTKSFGTLICNSASPCDSRIIINVIDETCGRPSQEGGVL